MRLTVFVMLLLLGLYPSEGKASNIVATVNDAAITSRDVSQRQLLMRVSQRGAAVSTKAALDDLIDEKIKLIAARDLGISITSSDVDRAFSSIAERSGMSLSQFNAALRSVGVDPASFKARIRGDLAWRDVVQQKFSRAIAVRDQDIVSAIKAKEAETPKQQLINEYQIARIAVLAPQGTSKSARRSAANSLRGKINGCEGLPQLAAGLKDTAYLPPQSRTSESLPKALDEALAKTAVGKAGPVQDTATGFEIPVVCEKLTVRSDKLANDGFDQALVASELETFAEKYLEELRGKVLIERK